MKAYYFFSILFFCVLYPFNAQELEQGKRFFYYERYKSAAESFQKILDQNPTDEEALYWLGQTYLERKDLPRAKSLYQKALTSNPKLPLALVGKGHIDLLENRPVEAQIAFKEALNRSGRKDVELLNAIARAQVKAKKGDVQYALQKLQQATELRRFKSPETYILMGDAYKKLSKGGDAALSYRKALEIDPKYAAAKYKEARLYAPERHKQVFLSKLDEALRLDPDYAPAYYARYAYWFYHDIDKAKRDYEKYLSLTDVTDDVNYEKASIAFMTKQYDEAIRAAKGHLEKPGSKADPRFYRLLAYAYDALNDSVNAKASIEQYFARQAEADFIVKDHLLRAKLLLKFPGDEQTAAQSFDKALALETDPEGQWALMEEIGEITKSAKAYSIEVLWRGKLYQTKKKPNNLDLYNWGYAAYQAGDYQRAEDVFKKYIENHPEEIYGYLWAARSAQALDPEMKKGLAAPYYEKFINLSKTVDVAQWKPSLAAALYYLAVYSAQIKKDFAVAIERLTRLLEIDPGNQKAAEFLELLKNS